MKRNLRSLVDFNDPMDKELWIEELVKAVSPEDWHYVGDTTDKLSPAFENSWQNFDVNRLARFYKDPFGVVHLDGLVSTGTLGATIFTLPVGYRPSHVNSNIHFSTVANSAFGEVYIGINGTVRGAGSNVWLSLSGITFRTE